MKYWQHLDLDGYDEFMVAKIVSSLPFEFHRLPFWTTLNRHNLKKAVPELFTALLKYDLVPKEVAIITLNRDTSTIHTDQTNGKNAGVVARLQLPLMNTAGSTTAFYHITEPPKRVRVENDPIYAAVGAKIWSDGGLDRLRFTPVTTVCVDRPTILRISEPHTVFCGTCVFPRVALTMSFEKDAATLFTE